MLELQNFIKTNSDWKDKLESPPYNLKIQEKDYRVLFKYNQINSDFSLPLVQEARGIILEKDIWKIVCRPFSKFFNYGETEAANIDWSSAIVQEKLDGSLLKCYFFNDLWRVATNGTIEAVDADLQDQVVVNKEKKIENYFDLFVYTIEKMFGRNYLYNILYPLFDKEYTHLFEICTPLNRVVVPHKKYTLYYLCSKHNESGEERYFKEVCNLFPMPKTFSFSTIDDCVKMAEQLPYDNEGYVVVDKYNHRVKIKSPAYLAIHHMKGEGAVTEKKVLQLILLNEGEEFLSYFPEHRETYTTLQQELLDLKMRMTLDARGLQEMVRGKKSRKEIALWANKQCVIPAFIFQLLDKRVENVEEFLYTIRVDKLLEYMEENK